MEVVLITGANKGLGFQTARILGKRGFHVLLAARSKELGEAAAKTLTDEGSKVTYIPLEVTNEESILAAAKLVESTVGRLDVLINNAGILNYNMNLNPSPVTDIRREFEVNYFGVINVTNAFLPLLSKAENPRIVNLSSILGSHGAHATPGSPIYGYMTSGYNASKAALNMYTQNLAHTLKNFKINSAHPGWVKTDMGGEHAPLSIDEGVETTVALATLDKDGPTGKFIHRGEEVPW